MMGKKGIGGCEIYLYGMTLLSRIHVLDGSYPEADTYREIKDSYTLLGGETANSAIILSSLGYRVKIDGPYLGTATKERILALCGHHGIDVSGVKDDPDYEGLQDLVLVDKSTRTVFGRFKRYFGDEKKRWSPPDKASIASSRIVSIDPFFGKESEQAAIYCTETGKNYVTIDCLPDSFLHQNAAATVLSNEYLQNKFPNVDPVNLFDEYRQNTEGLVIFTFGAKEIRYGRKGQPIRSFKPYAVDVAGTLGAGDTFRGGVVYGVLNQLDDEKIVQFAAATAGEVCARFPMALNPPKLKDIMKWVNES